MFETILQELESVRANARCKDVKKKLERLGFDVRDRKAGHKTIFHHHIPSFYSQGFDCGHGKNPEIKPIYIKKIISLLKDYEVELKQYLNEGNSND